MSKIVTETLEYKYCRECKHSTPPYEFTEWYCDLTQKDIPDQRSGIPEWCPLDNKAVEGK